MPSTESANDELLPSLLDRLIDPDSGGTAWRRGYSVEQMTAVIHRDLEYLLNTRQAYSEEELARFPPLNESMLNYGLPDLITLNGATPEQRQVIARTLEAVILRHEPRLREIRATLVEEVSRFERTLRFRIEAKMGADPAPLVAFDTLLELTSGHYTVQPEELQ